MNTESMTIKQSALRIIANAIIYSVEKKKKCTEYRFDGAFLRKVGIVTVFDIDALSKELSLLGWTLTMIDINNYAVQQTCYVMKNMLKLSDGRISKLSNKEIELVVNDTSALNKETKLTNEEDDKYNLDKLGFCLIKSIKAEPNLKFKKGDFASTGFNIDLQMDEYFGVLYIGSSFDNVNEDTNFELLSNAIKRGDIVDTMYEGSVVLAKIVGLSEKQRIRVYYKFYPGANLLKIYPIDKQGNVEWDFSKVVEVTKTNKNSIHNNGISE